MAPCCSLGPAFEAPSACLRAALPLAHPSPQRCRDPPGPHRPLTGPAPPAPPCIASCHVTAARRAAAGGVAMATRGAGAEGPVEPVGPVGRGRPGGGLRDKEGIRSLFGEEGKC